MSGSESDTSQHERTCCFGVALPPFMTNYQAVKRVEIRSPWLQIPHCTASVLIFFYIVFWQLAWNLRFMLTQDPDVSAVGRLQKPIAHWQTCTDEDFDCFMRVNATRAAYCRPASFGQDFIVDHTTVPNRTIQRCWRNDVHQKLATSFMIPTMVSFIEQVWMPGSETSDWSNVNVSEYYIEDIEAFNVRLFHSFLAEKVGLNGRSEDTQGFFSGEKLGVPLQHIPCKAGSSGEGCGYVDSQVVEGLEVCGDDNATSTACFSSVWGNVVSVQTILRAVLGPAEGTPFHLDMPRPDKAGYTYRQAGHAIRIEIEYFNLKVRHTARHILQNLWLHWDFGVLFKPKPAYQLHFRSVGAMPNATVSETEVRHAVDHTTGMPDPNRRVLHRTTGIWTTISHHGEIGAFSSRQLLLSLVTGLALFKLANLVVEHGLTRIYIRMQGTAHITMLWQMHKTDQSMKCHEFRASIVETNPEVLENAYSRGKMDETEMARLRHQQNKMETEKLIISEADDRF